MPTENDQGGQQGAGGGDGGQQPAGNGSQSNQASGGNDGMSLEQALAELEKTRKALKEVNGESAGRRKRLEELEAAEQARQQAAMSDAEKAAVEAKRLQGDLAQRDAALAALREQAVRYEVMLAAQGMGIVDLDAAVLLMDRGSLEFDESGKPTNVEPVLKKLVSAKPYLVKAAAGSSGLGTPAGKLKQQSGGDGDREAFEALVRRQIIR